MEEIRCGDCYSPMVEVKPMLLHGADDGDRILSVEEGYHCLSCGMRGSLAFFVAVDKIEEDESE
jgi:hypothetical protein